MARQATMARQLGLGGWIGVVGAFVLACGGGEAARPRADVADAAADAALEEAADLPAVEATEAGEDPAPETAVDADPPEAAPDGSGPDAEDAAGEDAAAEDATAEDAAAEAAEPGPEAGDPGAEDVPEATAADTGGETPVEPCVSSCEGLGCGDEDPVCGVPCTACPVGSCCEGQCVFLSSAETDCGRCGEACEGAAGTCLFGACGPCVASCDGRECGPDGCGGDCGPCGDGEVCDGGKCEPCAPDCAGRDCGPDGCGETCGACPAGKACADGTCAACAPACDGRFCGEDDGCGGRCAGPCPGGGSCLGGACVGGCVPLCIERECGYDGCGGTCGACASAPDPVCDGPRTAVRHGPDGTCVHGDCVYSARPTACPGRCEAGRCVACAADCAGRECGDDGCGGSCGGCAVPPPRVCIDDRTLRTWSAGECVAGLCAFGRTDEVCDHGCADGACTECTPDCKGRECGDDGCGGSCGTCDAPPSPACSDGWTLRLWDHTTSCKVGACAYGHEDRWCPHGCGSDACLDCLPACDGRNCGDDGCGGSCGTCDRPAAAECADAWTLRAYAASGTCNGGECDYGFTDKPCQYGCKGGQCRTCHPDCTGKVCGDDGCGGSCGDCLAPPAVSCPTPDTRRTWASPGTCGAGTCTYKSADEPCAHGCYKGACLPCKPDCSGRQCGGDGCGGSCGGCTVPPKPVCVNSTTLRTYAATGTCGGSTCSYGYADAACPNGCDLATGTCKPCTPQCTGRDCGDDGCGGSCGTCLPNKTCVAATGKCGACQPGGAPKCSADGYSILTCKADGSGWASVTCPYPQACQDAACRCLADSCLADGIECGPSSCGFDCGGCPSAGGDPDRTWCNPAGQCSEEPGAVGCSDGTREGFLDRSQFQGVAGCTATWPSMSLRTGSTHVPCGNALAKQCPTPADACADGWHVCGRTGWLGDLSQRVSQGICRSDLAGAGPWVTALTCARVEPTSTQTQCVGGFGDTDGHGSPLYCGSAAPMAGLSECFDGYRRLGMLLIGNQYAGCSVCQPPPNGGVMCCKDPPLM